MKIKWSESIYKTCEGGIGTRLFTKLKVEGAKFCIEHSPYVGQVCITIYADTMAIMKKALRLAREAGYIEAVAPAMKWVMFENRRRRAVIYGHPNKG